MTTETRNYDQQLQTICTNTKQKSKITDESDFSYTGFTSKSEENCAIMVFIYINYCHLIFSEVYNRGHI